MKEKRQTLLMALLLALLAWYLKPMFNVHPALPPVTKKQAEPPLPGENSISNLQIIKKPNGVYIAKFDYFYRGDIFPKLQALALAKPDDSQERHLTFGWVKPERGAHHAEIEVGRPVGQGETVTQSIVVVIGTYYDDNLHSHKKPEHVSATLAYPIEWPDMYTYLKLREESQKSTDTLYQEAVASIDQGSRQALNAAKTNLEQILLNDPKHVPAYVELARVAMKSNWGTEGLDQAEKYLKSALEIDSKHANSKVLLGYVYAHQKRYQEADAELTQAAQIGTPNTWLWANWGELFLMQGKDDQALDKYLHAVEGKRSYDTYDRARLDAYTHVFGLLERQRRLEQMDALYQKRMAEFGKYPCFASDYAWFRMSHYGDHRAGALNAKQALDNGCEKDFARYALGIAYYMSWVAQVDNSNNTLLAQARVFLPEGPRLFYELARGEETGKIIPKLLEKGLSLNIQDNEKLNALAYALMGKDLGATRRLAKAGARFDERVGEEQYPVAIIAFMDQNVPAIALMQELGVNFHDIKFKDMNALDYAKQMHNKAILDIVKKSPEYSL